MSVPGLIICIVTISLVITEIVCNRFIKKLTNYYWFGLAIGILCLVGFIAFRWVPCLQEFITHKEAIMKDPSSFNNSKIISAALLLDGCGFFGLTLFISLIADPSRTVARAIAPISFFTSFYTFCFYPVASFIPAHIDFKGLLIGQGPYPASFMIHFMLLTVSTGILLNTPKAGGKGGIGSTAAFVTFMVYVLICRAITGAAGDVGGFGPNDGAEGGEYHAVAKFLHIPPNVMAYVGPLGQYAQTLLILVFKDFVFDRFKGFKYPTQKSGQWSRGGNIEPIKTPLGIQKFKNKQKNKHA